MALTKSIISVVYIVCFVLVLGVSTPGPTTASAGEAPHGKIDRQAVNHPQPAGSVSSDKPLTNEPRRWDNELSVFGKWDSRDHIFGLKRVTLLGCLVLIILVAMFERASDLVICRSIRRMNATHSEESWTYGVLTAIRRPLTLFIFVYGISWTLTWHFWDGTFRWPSCRCR